jgi:hypothetical protein
MVPRKRAIHEAGHAVIGYVLHRGLYGNDNAFHSIVLRERGDERPIVHPITGLEISAKDGAVFSTSWPRRPGVINFSAAMLLLAVPVAQAKQSRKGLDDLTLVMDGIGDFTKAYELVGNRRAARERCRRETRRLVNRNWGAITALADQLQERLVLTLDEARSIIQPLIVE